jgi:hypothetical protein
MGLLVLVGGLSLASLASPTPVSESAKDDAPLHTHASVSVYRLPVVPRASTMPTNSQPEREESVRSRERLPLADDLSLLDQAYRKQGNTSFAMRVVGLSFGLDF